MTSLFAKLRSSLNIVVVSLLVTACGSKTATFNLEPTAATDVSAVKTVFAATSRAAVDDPTLMFSEERSTALSFVELEVGIPMRHRIGTVETVPAGQDPAKHFTLVGRRPVADAPALRREIDNRLQQQPPGRRELFVFVHGYNNSFASGVFRQAQMLHDFGGEAVALHYSWPSAGRPDGYVYDRDSAIFAQAGLLQVLRLAVSTKATQVTVFAHSMGSLVTMQALQLLAISGDAGTLSALDTVILAAPDVDIDVFDRIMMDLGRNRPQQFVVLVSDNDDALAISSALRGGHPRVGQGENAAFLQERGVVVLDVSKVDGGGHDTFAGSPTLIEMVKSGALEETLNSAQDTRETAVVVTDASDAASVLIRLPGQIISTVASAGSD